MVYSFLVNYILGNCHREKNSAALIPGGTGELLRGDDSPDRMTAGQKDAAVVDLAGGCRMRRRFGQFRTIDKRASACGAPVGFCARSEDRVALTADPFHG
jgi:hypothetical protein